MKDFNALYIKAKELKYINKYSLRKISKELGISISALSRWFNGVSIPGRKRRQFKDLSNESQLKIINGAKASGKKKRENRKILHELKFNRKFRERFFENRQKQCRKCGWKELNKLGFCPVQIHHIDGDINNNKDENLEVLCPNCHSLTDNFMFYGRNHNLK